MRVVAKVMRAALRRARARALRLCPRETRAGILDSRYGTRAPAPT